MLDWDEIIQDLFEILDKIEQIFEDIEIAEESEDAPDMTQWTYSAVVAALRSYE